MTKKLNETFGFEEQEDIEDTPEQIEEIEVISDNFDEDHENSGIEDHEKEMNDIYEIAMDAHEKTLDFGFGVDPKNASSGLNAATTYLNIALNASKSKIDKKLALLRLKNDKEKNKSLSNIQKEKESIVNENSENEDIVIGETLDRNQLVSEIRAMMQKEKEISEDNSEEDKEKGEE